MRNAAVFLTTLFTACALYFLPIFAGQVRVAWTASPSSNVVYVLYAHTNSLVETNLYTSLIRANVGTNQTMRVHFTNSGNWFLRVTASLDNVESEPSNELEIFVPEKPPGLKTVALEYTFELTNGAWTQAGNVFLKLNPNP